MGKFLRTTFCNSASIVASVLFIGLVIWWLSLHTVPHTSTTDALQLWGATYQVLAWYGAILGIFFAHRWGGLKSYMGRAVLAFSVGLLFQSFGQTMYSIYVYALHIPIPYPSIGDVGFFGSIPFYFYGAFMLARVSGARVSLRSVGNQILAFAIPIVLLGFSYFAFLQGYQFDFTQPLKVFLDFGYPLGQALYVSMAILAFLLSRKTLGGLMRSPILFFIGALVVQYLCDSMFLYESAKGTYYSGDWNDILYCTSYFVMVLALIYISRVFVGIKET